MIQPDFLYIEEADFILIDLYRFGNSTSPRFDNIRLFKDVAIIKLNGIDVIVANGNGISLSSIFDPTKKNTWKLAKYTPIPSGLVLVKDKRPGRSDHYMLAAS